LSSGFNRMMKLAALEFEVDGWRRDEKEGRAVMIEVDGWRRDEKGGKSSDERGLHAGSLN
jgi:hypothetical protein